MTKTSNTATAAAATYIVCSSCAAGLANDDWPHLDFYCDDEADAMIAIFIETAGWLSLTDSNVDTHGYFRCPCCGDDAIDGARFTAS